MGFKFAVVCNLDADCAYLREDDHQWCQSVHSCETKRYGAALLTVQLKYSLHDPQHGYIFWTCFYTFSTCFHVFKVHRASFIVRFCGLFLWDLDHPEASDSH